MNGRKTHSLSIRDSSRPIAGFAGVAEVQRRQLCPKSDFSGLTNIAFRIRILEKVDGGFGFLVRRGDE